MGSIVSSMLGGGGLGGSSESPLITDIHSEQEWKNRLEASKRSQSTMTITFSASWAGPGRFIEPVVHDLASKFPAIEFVKVDVDELPDAAKEFRIDAMPTYVIVKDGKESKRVAGAHKDELVKIIEESS